MLLLLFLIGIFLYQKSNNTRSTNEDVTQQPTPNTNQPVKSVVPEGEASLKTQKTLPGEQILKGYGSKVQTPKRDIEQVRELVTNTMFLVKNRDTREYATNEDLAEFLTGQNRYKQEMLPNQHPILNEAGQLVDRWGNPLVVHVIGRDKVEIFSPGPDGIPWNDDDIGRLPQYR